MKHIKKLLSFVIALALIVGMIPMSAITAHAIGEVLKGTYYAEAGETTTVTCLGGAIYQQTHFSIDGFGIGTVTKYDSDGTVEFEKDIFGSYSYSKTSCVAGEQFVFDMKYGSIEIFFTTSNVGYPAIEKVANNNSLIPPVKLNENPLYLTLGETQELFIEWTQPLYESQVISYSTDNSKVASVTEDGIITANCEGEAVITVDYYFIRTSDEKALSLEVECPVTVVDDVVDKNTGLRFYYSDEEIEPGDTVQIGADYSFGDFTGMYYPGTVEWKVSNENVLKVIQTVENITMVRVEALAIGECELSLLLDGEVKCTETIDVTLTDDTLIKEYKDYLMNCAVMTTLSDARDTCWDVIERYSSGSRTRIAFMTCLKEDLGLSVITKEGLAALGITSSTHQDTVDEAIDLLITEICSSEEAWFSDGLSSFKKRYKNYGAFTKTTAFTESSFEYSLAQFTSFSEKQIKDVSGVAKGFISDSISMAELVSAAVMTVQYERDVVVSLMNTVAAAPGGTNSDLYKGLERLLWEMDNLDVYVAHRYLNNKMVGSLQSLIEDGLFYSDDNFKMFDSTVWKVATGIGKLIALAYENEGGVFADDYMKTCVTSGFASTLYYALMNSDSASELEYSFKFYVPAVKVALNSAIGLCDDAIVNCSDLKGIAEGFLLQIEQTCTYENLLAQCRMAVKGASDFKSNVYMEDGEIVVDAYWELPETNALMLTDEDTGSFYTTGYTAEQLIIVPSHINGEKVTGIAANGFKGIANKYGIVLPDSVVKIGDYAFSDCPQVTFVVLGDNLKEIGAYAFNNNYALQVVNLPSSLEVIKEGAFNNCYNISSIITDATQIDAKAFNNCTSLSSVTIKNKNAVIAADAFDNCGSELTIYGYKNTDAEEIATAKGYTFVELSETVSAIEIVAPATKTEYEIGEVIDTAGMSLEVTYMDGTSEVVTDGWIAYGDTSNAGENTVKIYYGEKIVTYTITVREADVTSVELEYSELTMMYGEDIQFTAQILPDTSKNVKIVWATSNPDVVSVDINGYVEAIGVGTATITAKVLDSDVSATCTITVVDKKDIDPAITTTDYITFTARENGYYVFYSIGSGEKVTGSILDINGNTLYTNSSTNFRVEGQLHKDKTYTLKTTTSSSNNIFNVVINKSVDAESVVIKDSNGSEISELSGFPRDTKNLYYGFTPVNYITETCTWESSDTAVATVTTEGKVTMVAPGTATITVKSENGLTDTCEVTVKEFTEAPNINVGDTKTVTISELGAKQYFSFTPEEDGWYVFYSKEDANGRSHYGTLYEADGTYIKGGINYSADEAYIEYEYTAGVTYIIQTSYVSSYNGTGTYEVCLDVLPPAESLTVVEGDSFEGYPFEEIYLSAEFSPEWHIPENFVWSSSNTDVATVSSYGTVSLLKAGTTTISVTSDNGLTDTCEITVKEFPKILLDETKSIEITENRKVGYYSFTPEEDGWYAFYSISDADTSGDLYNSSGSWLTGDNNSGADSNFRIEYQMTAGETYIFESSYNYGSTVGTFDVKLEKMIAAESISIVQGDVLTGYINDTVDLSVEFAPTDCIKETVTWTSSDETVATVDNYGYVSMLAAGTTDITATSENGLTATCKITVTDYPTINAGEQKTVEITDSQRNGYFYFTPEDDGTYVFYSISDSDTYGYLLNSDGSSITSNDDGGDGSNFRIEYALTGGQKYILKCKFYSSSKVGTFDVRLIELVDAESIQITDGDTFTDYVGTYHTLTTEFSPENSRDEDLTWSSSDDTVVSVDEYGGIELLAIGTATITVTTENGLTDSIVVTVTDYPEIQLDETKTIEITETNSYEYFKFTPTENGTYIFTVDSDHYTEISISTADGDYVGSYDGYDFAPRYKLTANTTYYIYTGLYYWEETGTYTLQITKAPSATSMEISNGDSISAFVGDELYMWLNFAPSGCASETVTWVSNNTSVATVDSYGYVDIVGAGTATITATSENGLTDSVVITATVRPVATSVQIGNSDTITGYVGDSVYLWVNFEPDNCVEEEITWTSNNSAVASVDEYGEVTFVGIGTATITATSENGLTDTCVIEVKNIPTIVCGEEKVLNTNTDSGVGMFSFVPTVDGSYAFYSYNNGFDTYGYILDEDMNTLDSNDDDGDGDNFRVVYSMTAGTQYYLKSRPYSNGSSGEYSVKVVQLVPATSFEITNGDSISGYVNYGYYLDTKFNPENAITESITWTSSDTDVATVSSYGYVNFVSAGTATITATTENGLTDSITVTVNDRPKATSIEIANGDNITGYVGVEKDLWVNFYPEDCTSETVIWSSDNEEVATVNDYGEVTFLAAGTVNITVTSENGLTDTCTITVKECPTLTVEQPVMVTISDNQQEYMKFIPTESGKYRFFASELSNNNSPYFNLYNEAMNYLYYGYDYLDYELVAGNTYYISANYYSYSNGGEGTFYVNAVKLVEAESVSIIPDTICGYEGYSYSLNTKFSPDNSIIENISWVSSDPSIVTVDNYGHITFVSAGTATITATSENGLVATASVTVKAAETISLDEEKTGTVAEDVIGSVFKFIPTETAVYMVNVDGNHYTHTYIMDSDGNWVNSDYAYGIALEQQLEAGKTYYICTSYWYEGDYGDYTVFIEKLVPATSVEITSNDTISGYVDGNYSLSTEFYPDNAITEDISWTSSDETVAEVDDWGNVSFVGAGTATITATTENGLTDSVVVTVMTIPEVVLDEVNTVEITSNNQSKRYKFTPSETGSYSFEIESEYSIYFGIYDEYDNYVTGSNNTFNYQLTAGKTYYISTHYTGGNTGSYTFKISEAAAISELEITALPDRMDYYVGFENFSYYGLKLKATFDDGTTVDWSYDSWDSLAGYDVEIEDDYFDSTYLETIVSCGGQTVSFEFNVKENPVDHLELVSGTSRAYIENYNGYTNDDGDFIYWTNHPNDAVIKIVYTDGTSVTANVGDYVEEYYVSWDDNQDNEPWIVGTENKSTISYLGHTANLPITVEENKVDSIEVVSGKVTCIENTYGYDMGDGNYYYNYNMPSDVTVKINYTDGTSKTVNVTDTVDGYSFEWSSDQYETPWVLGDDNYLTLSYLGATTQLPVSIIVNPVDHIEINTAPTREYIYGDTEYGYLYSDGEYEFYPSDLTGLSFIVYYTDGTSKTFTYDDIDENDNINGYGYELNYESYNPEIGDFPVTFEYMGKTDDYTVVLKESTVASIAVTKKPTKTEYTNDYSPDFVGTEFTITYTEGTTKVITLSEDNLVYEYTPWWGELCYKVDVDGHTLMIEPYYDDDSMYYVAYYLGSKCEIKDITFIESKEISSVELDNVSWNGEGMTVKVTYTDETTEKLMIEIADYYDWEDSSISAYGKTENGLLYYYIETYTDEDGNAEKYMVRIFGKEITVEAETVMIGDVNGDGTLNNKDVIMLRRHLVGGWNVTIDTIAADVNADGSINNKDVIMLRRYLVGGWDVVLG